MGRKAMNKTRKDDPDKKMAWIETLIPWLQSEGLKGLTMDDFAKKLGVSKATVYKYFRGKREIIEAGLALKLQRIGRFKGVLNDRSLPFYERYFNSITLLSNEIAGISTVFLKDLKNGYPDLWQMIHHFIGEVLEEIAGYYREGITHGYFIPVHPALLIESDRHFFMLLSDPEFLSENQLTIEEAFMQYFRMKFIGIAKKLREFEAIFPEAAAAAKE